MTYPSNCIDTVCTFIYKWKNNGGNQVHFKIAAQIGYITSNWVGIAFSLDNKMVIDSSYHWIIIILF